MNHCHSFFWENHMWLATCFAKTFVSQSSQSEKVCMYMLCEKTYNLHGDAIWTGRLRPLSPSDWRKKHPKAAESEMFTSSKKCMTKNHATLGAKQHNLYQQPQKTNTSGCDWFFPWAFLHPKSVCFFLLFWLSGFRSTSRGTFRSQQIEKNTAEFRPCMVCCAKKTHWDTTSLPRKRNDILQ